MGLLKELRLRFRPPTLEDPDFGRLLFMHVPRDPSKSYWEAEWLFPPTGTRISIGLPGPADGPAEAGRSFYLALPARFGEILAASRPVLDRVFREWIGRPLHSDLLARRHAHRIRPRGSGCRAGLLTARPSTRTLARSSRCSRASRNSTTSSSSPVHFRFAPWHARCDRRRRARPPHCLPASLSERRAPRKRTTS